MTTDIRDEAVLILAVCASTRSWGIAIEADALDASADAQQLAVDAWRASDTGESQPSFGSGDWAESWRIYFDKCAEAEAMLRTGWTP